MWGRRHRRTVRQPATSCSRPRPPNRRRPGRDPSPRTPGRFPQNHPDQPAQGPATLRTAAPGRGPERGPDQPDALPHPVCLACPGPPCPSEARQNRPELVTAPITLTLSPSHVCVNTQRVASDRQDPVFSLRREGRTADGRADCDPTRGSGSVAGETHGPPVGGVDHPDGVESSVRKDLPFLPPCATEARCWSRPTSGRVTEYLPDLLAEVCPVERARPQPPGCPGRVHTLGAPRRPWTVSGALRHRLDVRVVPGAAGTGCGSTRDCAGVEVSGLPGADEIAGRPVVW